MTTKLFRTISRLAFVFVLAAGLYCLGGCKGDKTEDATDDPKIMKLNRLGRYSAEGRWDDILRECASDESNALYICFRNRALAEKGVLAEQLFRYPQAGPAGLLVKWNTSPEVSALLSDVYFTVGDIATSQHMAFESLVVASQRQVKPATDEDPAMLQRLVQTNLINGAHAVAEKYIKALERMDGYETWCKQYRPFLYDDAKVATDPLLGRKRKCIPKENHLIRLSDLERNWLAIARANPDSRTAIEYVGSMYLLDKQLNKFRRLVEENFNTPVLPTLPRSFQEAVIATAETDTAYWHKYGVTDATSGRFNEYKQTLFANRGNPNLSNVMRQRFGDTFWYYLMFTK